MKVDIYDFGKYLLKKSKKEFTCELDAKELETITNKYVKLQKYLEVRNNRIVKLNRLKNIKDILFTLEADEVQALIDKANDIAFKDINENVVEVDFEIIIKSFWYSDIGVIYNKYLKNLPCNLLCTEEELNNFEIIFRTTLMSCWRDGSFYKGYDNKDDFPNLKEIEVYVDGYELKDVNERAEYTFSLTSQRCIIKYLSKHDCSKIEFILGYIHNLFNREYRQPHIYHSINRINIYNIHCPFGLS